MWKKPGEKTGGLGPSSWRVNKDAGRIAIMGYTASEKAVGAGDKTLGSLLKSQTDDFVKSSGVNPYDIINEGAKKYPIYLKNQ